MLVIETNDIAITLSEAGRILYQEPALAFVEKKSIAFGFDASRQSRLHPRQTEDQFWYRLNEEPLATPSDVARNQADLVYAHLTKITENVDRRDDVILVTPSSTSPEQMSLLLGIAQAAGLNVRLIIDAAAVSSADLALSRRTAFVDITMHAAVVSTLELNEQVTSRDGAEVAEAGMRSLLEGWVDAVADRFIDQTRFDPLRIAATEQQVFDQLIKAVDQGGMPPTFGVSIDHAGETRRVDVTAEMLENRNARRLDKLVEAARGFDHVVLSEHAKAMPGLDDRLRAEGVSIEIASREAARQTIDRESTALLADASGVRHVATFPRTPVQEVERTPKETRPTHLLRGGVAVALESGMDFRSHPSSHLDAAVDTGINAGADGVVITGATHAVSINETAYAKQSVKPGDVVRVAGETFQFILVDV